MAEISALNLIHLFDFYLASMFVIGLFRRWGVYRDTVLLVIGLRARWPKLLGKLNQHKAHLLTATTLRPIVLALTLTVAQMVASRLIWPQALLSFQDLGHSWLAAVLVGLAFIPMFAVDCYFLIRVGSFDRDETEKYLDKAEKWLVGWKAPTIKIVTLGFVNPHKIVDTEVKKSLTDLGATAAWAMWWASTQIALRLLFGLVLWGAWWAV